MNNSYTQLLKTTSFANRKNIKVTVGLSGGVDSAITAYLLKKDGFNVTAVYMMCFDDGTPNCRSKQDKSDAIKVAGFLDIPIEIWNFETEYKKYVTDYFIDGYKKGLTPNPDILCNSEIKFKFFLNKALETGAEYVATGHYSKIVNYTDTLYLAIPKDKTKDQTYFLSDINKTILNKLLFPLGEFNKSEVRKIAKEIKLPVANKKDSTGICFLEGIKMQDFLRKEIEEKVGDVKDKNGLVIGKHKGVWFYTIGQRHGFTIDKYIGKALYVIGKDPKNNLLIVGDKKDLLKSEITVDSVIKFTDYNDLFLRIRNLGKLVEIVKIESNKLTINPKLDSIAPGQFVVVYKKVENDYLVWENKEIML